MNRFTIDGSDALEARLEDTCRKVVAGISALVPARKLQAVLLGGGYGRGEGGVLRSSEGDVPYNDLEFYVFLRGNAVLAERQFRHALHELGERLTPEAGLEVEFKVLTAPKLRRSPPSMFYYDLVCGHRLVLGSASVLEGCEHHRNAAAIPMHEATRLLFNRCSGLLFSMDRLAKPRFDAGDADFVGRNLAKAQLAFGDVLLTARGLYHWSCRERQRRLEQMDLGGSLSWATPLREHHAAGVSFKLHPVRSTDSHERLAAHHAVLSSLGRQLWLWLETERLQVHFSTVRSYATSLIDKCPETRPARNRLVNARTFGLSGLAQGRYPRERLFHALALLLWEPGALEDTELLSVLQSNLGPHAKGSHGFVEAYRSLWSRFN